MYCAPFKKPGQRPGFSHTVLSFLLLRKRVRSARLLGPKRPRDGSRSLPTILRVTRIVASQSKLTAYPKRRPRRRDACGALVSRGGAGPPKKTAAGVWAGGCLVSLGGLTWRLPRRRRRRRRWRRPWGCCPCR